MTEQSEALVEELTRIIQRGEHAPFGETARAILPIIQAREAAAKADAERLAEDATIIIRSLMREIGLSNHTARKPEPVDGKTQWVSARDLLTRLAAWEKSRG